MAGSVRKPRDPERSRFPGLSPVRRLTLLSAVSLGLGLLAATVPGSSQSPHQRPARALESTGTTETLPAVSPTEPSYFTPGELEILERHFGVHGAQPALAQLFFEGVGQFRPLRRQTLSQLQEIRPTLLQECARLKVNPMLVAAVLYEEVQLAKPGEHLPMAAHSGLIRTHGLAQISLEELVIQGRLRADATEAEKHEAVDQLLDPDENVRVLVRKFARLARKLQLPEDRTLQISGGPGEIKALATLAYLYNGKLDYPGRILRHMEDPELHGLIYSQRQKAISALI